MKKDGKNSNVTSSLYNYETQAQYIKE